MSLLTICQEVCGRLSLTIPPIVVGSTDPQVVQLYTLTNVAGRQIAQGFNWQALTLEQSFVTTGTTDQPGAIPTDLDRFIANTFNNRTTRRPVLGPVTPQVWQWLIAQPAYSTVYLMYREREGDFLVGPPTVAPPAGQTIAFEYVSKNWAKTAGGTPLPKFLADDDETYLDDSLLTDSCVWQFLRAKGMSYAEEMATFERNLDEAKGRDGGSSRLHLSPSVIDLNRLNLPDGNFGP